jgi:hypothetical protein
MADISMLPPDRTTGVPIPASDPNDLKQAITNVNAEVADVGTLATLSFVIANS